MAFGWHPIYEMENHWKSSSHVWNHQPAIVTETTAALKNTCSAPFPMKTCMQIHPIP
jgi:hypothetical protein